MISLEEGQLQRISVGDFPLGVVATTDPSAPMNLAGRGHNALFVDEIEWEGTDGAELDFSDFLGVLRVESSSQLAATVIQTRPGEFATLPVVPSLN